ncbi:MULTISPECIES: GrpB family protein [Lysinibacillus]|uniref:GrpB family protein n=1 Tax=Lysinibacillus TaxID=400634 RepID=UPI002AD4E973|nr:GrpB family protein [Lysinibacillus irui]MEA0563327.1 GrpB family protein [Lysinibacillus irui]
MSDPILILPYTDEWAKEFHSIGSRLREALGDNALRIDHIGSTSITGLAAKPVIDIQLSVASFTPLEAFKGPLECLDFIYRANNPDKSKRYFREAPGHRRVHIHVRQAGSWAEQLALLFRDFLRCHPDYCRRYEQVKCEFAEKYINNRQLYTNSKEAIIWEILKQANQWSQLTGWSPSRSDS